MKIHTGSIILGMIIGIVLVYIYNLTKTPALVQTTVVPQTIPVTERVIFQSPTRTTNSTTTVTPNI